jgi:hypothetical protein
MNKSPRSAESAFHRSIQPVNVYSKIRRTSLDTNVEEKIYFDGTKSILEFIGFTPVLVAITRESVQCISQQFIDAHNFVKETFIKALPYKDIFLHWVTQFCFDLHRKATNYALNLKSVDKKQMDGMTAVNSYNDDDYQGSSEQYDDSDSHSTFSNADTDISSPQQSNPKVAELENEILILKQQLSFVLTQMNIKIPSNATESIPAPPPPPPLPQNLFKCSEVKVDRPKRNIPESEQKPPQAVPRITEILGDLSKVQLRHVPRSPGGTPCRNRIVSVTDTMADAVKDALDKRRIKLDVSLDENGLNDSWEEEEKEN